MCTNSRIIKESENLVDLPCSISDPSRPFFQISKSYKWNIVIMGTS